MYTLLYALPSVDFNSIGILSCFSNLAQSVRTELPFYVIPYDEKSGNFAHFDGNAESYVILVETYMCSKMLFVAII